MPRGYFERFLAAAAAGSRDSAALRERVRLLLPVYELKWCCIMLNEFLPVGDDRRAFARVEENREIHRHSQLEKVEAALARLRG